VGEKKRVPMTSHELPVKVAINSWRLVVERADEIFSRLTEDQPLREVAPGKNRVIYLWGHLIAVHDRMFSILGLRPRLHLELDAVFIDNPDRAVSEKPSAGQLKQYWHEVNEKSIGCLAESNKSPVLPSRTGDVGSQIASPTRGRRTGDRAEPANEEPYCPARCSLSHFRLVVGFLQVSAKLITHRR
jgi:hypothetical protein